MSLQAHKPKPAYRQRILREIGKQHVSLVALLDSLGEPDFEKVRGKAVMAHLTAWEQRMLRQIHDIVVGEAARPELGLAEFNARVDAKAGPRPLGDIRQEFDDSYGEVIHFISELPESAFEKREVKLLIGYNTHGHYRWALDKIRQRLASAPPHD